MRRIVLAMIAVYKRFVSPLLPPACRFYPTCSEYCRDAVCEHGVARGVWMGFRRLLRCNPLFRGGFDPVPPRRASPRDSADRQETEVKRRDEACTAGS